MEVRPDTSSSRSQDGWSFLNHGTSAQDAQAPSQQPSSYIRSDRSSVSPLPNGQHTHNGSRSSFSRNILSASSGARSTTTIPSQPVLLRIDSASAREHNNRAPRRSQRPIKMAQTGLPAQEEFSIQGILSAIYEDIEGDLDTIAEVLGRSRFVLADQYESQMPPQGEITMTGPLQGIEETTASDERLVRDDVLIVDQDASLVDGSNSGSARFRLMEAMHTVANPQRLSNDAPVLMTASAQDIAAPTRTHSSPAVTQPEPESPFATPNVRMGHRYPVALRPERGLALPVVSETYISAEADGAIPVLVPIISEAGRQYSLYCHDNASLFETTSFVRRTAGLNGQGDGWILPDFSGFTSWFSRGQSNTEQNAEARLRSLLNR